MSWLDRFKKKGPEAAPPPLRTEEHIEFSDKTFQEVERELERRGATFAGKNERDWLAANPDATATGRFKDGSEYVFFGDKEGYIVFMLRWDSRQNKFIKSDYTFNAHGSPKIWGASRDLAQPYTRRVVMIG